MKQIDCVIIPARGGSKRIPRKNMQPFCGIPMLEISIELAKKLSDNVIVSSDDYSMLEFAKNLGAYPLLRDKALADDMTPTLPVIIHALLPFIKVDSFDKGLLDSKLLFSSLFDSNTLRHKSQNNKSLDLVILVIVILSVEKYLAYQIKIFHLFQRLNMIGF